MADHQNVDRLWSLSIGLDVPSVFVVGPRSKTDLSDSGPPRDSAWGKISTAFSGLTAKPFEAETTDEQPMRFICVDKEALDLPKYNLDTHLKIDDASLGFASCLQEWLLEHRSKPALIIHAYSLSNDDQGAARSDNAPPESDHPPQDRGSVVGYPNPYMLDLCDEIKKDKDTCEPRGISFICLLLMSKSAASGEELAAGLVNFVSRMCGLIPGVTCIPIVEDSTVAPVVFLKSILKTVHSVCIMPYKIIRNDIFNKFINDVKPELNNNAPEDSYNKSVMNLILQYPQIVSRFKYTLMLSVVHELTGEWDTAVRGYAACIDIGPELYKTLSADKRYIQIEDLQYELNVLHNILDYIAMKICTALLYMGLSSCAVAQFRKYIDNVRSICAQSKTNPIIRASGSAAIQANEKILKVRAMERFSKLYFKFSELVKKYDGVCSQQKNKLHAKRDSIGPVSSHPDQSATSSLQTNLDGEHTEIISKLSSAGKAAIGMVTTFIRTTFKRTPSSENVLVDRNVLDPYYCYYLQGVNYFKDAFYMSVSDIDDQSHEFLRNSPEVKALLRLFEDAIVIFSANNYTRIVNCLSFELANIYRLQGLYDIAVDSYIKCGSLVSDEIFKSFIPEFFLQMTSSCKSTHSGPSAVILTRLLGTPPSAQASDNALLIISKLTEVICGSEKRQESLEIQCHSQLCPAFFDCNFCIYPNKTYLNRECTYQLTIFRPRDAFLTGMQLSKLKLIFSDRGYDHDYFHSTPEVEPDPAQKFKLFCIDSVVNKNGTQPAGVDLNSYHFAVIKRRLVCKEPVKLIISKLLTIWKVGDTEIVIKYRLRKEHLSHSVVARDRKWFLAPGEACQDARIKSMDLKCLHDNLGLVVVPEIPNISIDIVYERLSNTGYNVPVVLKIRNDDEVSTSLSVYMELCGDSNLNSSNAVISESMLSEDDQMSLHMSPTSCNSERARMLIRGVVIAKKNTYETILWVFIPFQASGTFRLSVALMIDQQHSDPSASSNVNEQQFTRQLSPSEYYLLHEIREIYGFMDFNQQKSRVTSSNCCVIQKMVEMCFTKKFQSDFDIYRIPGNHLLLSPDHPTESLVYTTEPIHPHNSGINLEYRVGLRVKVTGKSSIIIKELVLVDEKASEEQQNNTVMSPYINVYCSATGSKRLFCTSSDNGMVECLPAVIYRFCMKATIFYNLDSIIRCSDTKGSPTSSSAGKFIKVTWRPSQTPAICGDVLRDRWHVALVCLGFPPNDTPHPVSIDMHLGQVPVYLKPFDIRYVVYNHTMKTHNIEIKVISSENVPFSGYERISFHLLPLSSREFVFTALPLISGKATMPKIVAALQSDSPSSLKRAFLTTVTDVALSPGFILDENDISLFVLPKDHADIQHIA